MKSNINAIDRVGNEAEQPSDDRKIESIKRYAFKSYQDEVVVKMQYVDAVSTFQSIPIGTSGIYQYKVNSIWDPDLTGAGGQPLGRDTWAAIYNYYKVLECNIHVELVDLNHFASITVPSDGSSSPTYYGGMLDITATPPTNKRAWFEASSVNHNSRQQVFTKPVPYNVMMSRGPNHIDVNMTWTPDMFEKNVLVGGGDPGWNAVGSDPNILEYFTLIAANPQSAGSRYCTWVTRVEYIVAFKQIAKSLLNTNQ